MFFVAQHSKTIAAACFAAVLFARANDRPYAIVPGIKVSPEVGIGVGAVAFHSALPEPGSRFDVKLLVTTRSQIDARIRHRNLNFLGSDWELRGEAEALRFPDSYFGPGNSHDDSEETYYTPQGGRLGLEFLRPVKAFRFLLAGKVESFSIIDKRKANPDSVLQAVLVPGVLGYKGGTTDLWEVGVEYDTRDNLDVPKQGVYAGQRIGTSLAGEFQYQSFETWVNGYYPLGEHWETSVRLWQKTLGGEPPFFVEPWLGDENILRGVNHKRFRDKSAQSAQAEVRFGFPLSLPLIDAWLGHEWQLATFAEAGRVGSDFVEASQADMHYSGGVGGRLVIGKRLGVIRGDLAFSAYGFALIIDFNQAF